MSLLSTSLYLAVGAVAAVAAGTLPSLGEPAVDEPVAVRAPAGLVITSPRICAALAVYRFADHDDWGLRGTIAMATLNGFRDAGAVPDCAAGVTAVAQTLEDDASQRRWQAALDAVDAVTSGDFSISPDACARANTIIPLSIVPASPPDAAPPAAARAQCVIYDLAFVEVRP
ncbi:hypothetical protein [Stenotrophomonas acidaminiphila]|uniref:hypothetical protein n=1 Tax=Stenotrophomonas acidaminiphila TaxID=128780 RepID=UPI0028B1EB4B|nr:hypothetical protein [Stenotrophomonas acidaminiphila]